MDFLRTWRTALRIARREARRAKGRSALVVAMIALPVLALTFAAASYDMFDLTGAERADRTMGTADARIQWPTHREVRQLPDPGDGWDMPGDIRDGGDGGEDMEGTGAELAAALPSGSTVLPVRRGSVSVRTPDGLGRPDAVMVDARSPLTHGYIELLEGRAPARTGEVALTEPAMTWLHAGIADTVTIYDGDAERPYTVVGQVEFPSVLDRVLLFAPDDAGEWFAERDHSWLADTPSPIDWPAVLQLNRQGMLVTSRAVLENPPPDDEVPLRQAWAAGGMDTRELGLGVLVAGLGLLEVVLLAGPAFAVSARRRQRQLALVAANGGTAAHVRRIVLADGVVLGLVGAVAGIVIGIVGAVVARPWLEEFVAHRAGGYRFYPVALAAIAVMAVLTGLAAALVPAFITARQSVLASLAGRRGATRSRKRWIALGVVMIGIGAAVTVGGTLRSDATIMLGGLVLAELGLVLCTPALVGLVARLGRLVPLAPRIALRDAARNRAAAAPAISAVMAAVAGSVLLGMILVSDQAHSAATWYQENPTGTVIAYGRSADGEAISRAVRATLPVDEVNAVGRPVCTAPEDSDKYCSLEVALNDLCPQLSAWQNGALSDAERAAAGANPACDIRAAYTGGSVVVDDGEALASLTGASGDDLRRARETLAAGGIVVRSPLQLTNGVVTAVVTVPDPDATPADLEGQPQQIARGVWVQPGFTARLMTVPGYLLTSAIGPGSPVVPHALVASAGLAVENDRFVATPTRLPTGADLERFGATMRGLDAVGFVESGYTDDTDPVLWLLIGAAGMITVGAAAIGTGLAAADGRADLSTLAAVGASPTLRRGLSVSQSGVVAGLGSILGSLAGIGAAYAVIAGGNQDPWLRLWPSVPTQPVLPWEVLAAVLVAVPLIAILGAGLLTRSRLPIERRL